MRKTLPIVESLQPRVLFAVSFDTSWDNYEEYFERAREANTSGPIVEVHGRTMRDKVIVRRNQYADIQIVWGDGEVWDMNRGQLHLVLLGGRDSVYVDPIFGDIPLTIYGGGGNDTIYGGRGDDRLYGGDGDDFIFAGDGRDTCYGELGDDFLRGGGGSDLLGGGDGFDSLRGDAGNDNLDGGASKDRINGSAGHDRIYGGGGNDICAGEDGDDTVHGGRGVDLLSGGAGRDDFSIDETAERTDFTNEDLALPLG